VTGPIATIPNLVSAIRIALVPVFLWLMFGPGNYAAAGWLLGGIAATDWVDGFLARRLGQVSELGKVLDPVADRLAVASAVVAGWITGTLPWWFALALVVRETLVTLGAAVLAARTGRKIAVRRLGKAATFGVYVAVPNFIIEAGTGYAFHLWVAWIFGIPGLVLYYAVLFQYFGDIRRAAAGVSSATVDQEGAG
jgi:cardiolipin synthase